MASLIKLNLNMANKLDNVRFIKQFYVDVRAKFETTYTIHKMHKKI